jgi:hypothetical protein
MASNNFNNWLQRMGEQPLPEVQPEFEVEELDRMLARLETQLNIDTSKPIEETIEATAAEAETKEVEK